MSSPIKSGRRGTGDDHPPAAGAGQSATPRDVILFDGECAFCASGIAWVCARDRLQRFEFVPYQAPAVAQRYPGLDPLSMAVELHVVTPEGRILRAVDAAARIFRRLPGWGWLGYLLESPALGWAARPAYRWVARRRSGLLGGPAACRLVGP